MTKRRAGAARIEDHGMPALDVNAVRKSFPVVGIGASAGGLEAVTETVAREIAARVGQQRAVL